MWDRILHFKKYMGEKRVKANYVRERVLGRYIRSITHRPQGTVRSLCSHMFGEVVQYIHQTHIQRCNVHVNRKGNPGICIDNGRHIDCDRYDVSNGV